MAVGGAALLFGFGVVTGFLFIALMLPLIPVFIGIVMGNVCLLATALQYAARVSVPASAGMLAGKHEQGAAQRPSAARSV
jgi:hypothetical protein